MAVKSGVMNRDLSDSNDVKRMSPAEVKKLNKDQLQFALRTLMGESSEDTAAGPAVIQMTRIETKIDNLLEKWSKEKEELRNEIKGLRKEKEKISETLAQHQKMLEMLEADRRASNVIMTGVSEEQIGDADTDTKKVQLILTTIGQPGVQVKNVERLGKPTQDQRQSTGGNSRPYRRPLKVVLKDPGARKDVLECARKLKDSDDQLKTVYIKKDVHPLVRKELNRLRDVTKTEKERPENQGKNVRYDFKERKVYVGDVVVDSFQSVPI